MSFKAQRSAYYIEDTVPCGVLHVSDLCLPHICLFKKLFSIWPHGYSKDVRAPSQFYKWVSHNEYDDTKQKYSSVSPGNSYNHIYSILPCQMHYRNALCSKGLLNHLWKNSEIDVGKSDFEPSIEKEWISKAMLHFQIYCSGYWIIFGLVAEETHLLC